MVLSTLTTSEPLPHPEPLTIMKASDYVTGDNSLAVLKRFALGLKC